MYKRQSLGFGYYYSKKNASEIALLRKSFENGGGSQKVDFSDNPLARPKLFWANFALFLGSLACFIDVYKRQGQHLCDADSVGHIR